MDGHVRNVNERGYAFIRGEDGENYVIAHMGSGQDLAGRVGHE